MKDANEILLIWRLGEMGRLRDCALPKAGNRPSRSDWIRPHLAGDLRVPTEAHDGFTDSHRISTNSAARCDGHHEPEHRWVMVWPQMPRSVRHRDSKDRTRGPDDEMPWQRLILKQRFDPVEDGSL